MGYFAKLVVCSTLYTYTYALITNWADWLGLSACRVCNIGGTLCGRSAVLNMGGTRARSTSSSDSINQTDVSIPVSTLIVFARYDKLTELTCPFITSHYTLHFTSPHCTLTPVFYRWLIISRCSIAMHIACVYMYYVHETVPSGQISVYVEVRREWLRWCNADKSMAGRAGPGRRAAEAGAGKQ